MDSYFCYGCHQLKERSKFGEHKTKGRQYRCKECRVRYQREWYSKNRALHIGRAAVYNKIKLRELRKIKLDFLLKNPCRDCGENNPIVLDFDHVRGTKKHNVSTMVAKKGSTEKLLQEISKCEIRCANCHRIATHKRRNKKEENVPIF